MKVRIVNVYNNDVLPDRGLKGSHGNSFYLEIGQEKILFDTGWKGKILLSNMSRLGISPDDIDKIVLSHGHSDHSGGLPALLEARTNKEPVQVIAHPGALESKAVVFFGIRVFPLGFPRLGEMSRQQVQFTLVKEPLEVAPHLTTTGEILNRPEKDGTQPPLWHKPNGKWEPDPILDDLSLVLEAKDGLVIIGGCCHAGLLNTCAHVTRMFDKKILSFVGGSHMLRFTREEISHVANVLEQTYGLPQLYLNHCTGKRAMAQIKERFGSEIAHDCRVGTELTCETD